MDSLRRIRTVGLTGGIGSGRSTVSALRCANGAVVLDADVMAREAIELEAPGLAAVADAFGPRWCGRTLLGHEGLGLDGACAATSATRSSQRDRAPARYGSLDEPVGRYTARQVSRWSRTSIPMRVEDGLQDRYDVVVVSIPPRSSTGSCASAAWRRPTLVQRIAAQVSRADRLAVADDVLRKDGSVEERQEEVDQSWPEREDGSSERPAP